MYYKHTHYTHIHAHNICCTYTLYVFFYCIYTVLNAYTPKHTLYIYSVTLYIYTVTLYIHIQCDTIHIHCDTIHTYTL